MDRLAGMESFVAIVETGSFSTAAKRLGLTRAVVSKRVAALEGELGTQLLHRTTRQVCVTGTGAEFYEHARAIVTAFAFARQQISLSQAEPEGLIKLNAPMSFSQLHLAPALPEFMRRYPRIAVQLTMTDRFVDVIAEGYDLVIRISSMDDSSLVGRRLASVGRVLCASPDYLEANGTPATPQDLKDHRILHYGWQQPSAKWQLFRGEEPVTVEMPVSFCANNGDVLTSAAVEGGGIIVMPLFIVAELLRAGKLVRVLPEYRASTLSLHVLWPTNRRMPSRVRQFIDFLVERFADRSDWDAD